MEGRKVGAIEKTTPQMEEEEVSSSEVKVKVEPQMERNTVFNSQVGQPGVTHIWNDAQLPFSGPLPGRPQYNICQHNDLDQERDPMQLQIRQYQQYQQQQLQLQSQPQIQQFQQMQLQSQPQIRQFQQPGQHGNLPEVLPQLDQNKKLTLMQMQMQSHQQIQQLRQLQQLPYQFGLSGVTHIRNGAQLPLPGPVPGRPQLNFCQMQQMMSQQQLKGLRPHLNSHASKQPGAAAPIAPNEAHIDDEVISKKRSQEQLSQVGELAAGSRTNRMRYTHSAEAQVQPGMQQHRFFQILEEFNTKFEEGMIKMEERMTKFEERMAIVPQLVDRISELEKNLENLASIRSKDTGNTTTLVEGKLTNLTISDINPEEGSTSEQEGYTCGEDFVHLSEE